MKNYILLLIVVVFSTHTVLAQSDAYAQKLLDQVSKKYDGYKTIQAEFTLKIDQVEGPGYTDNGILHLNKNNQQYKISLKEQELISNGKSVWSVLKEEKEVQITDVDNNSTSIGPNNIFTFYKKGFKYVSMDDERVNGETMTVIELAPIDTKNNYFKIKLRVNPKKHIHDVLIFDKSGAKYSYTIKALYVNHTLNPNIFVFDKSKYATFDIVDLR